MRILHTITTINRGGAENYLHELVVDQIRAGNEVAVAYLKGDGYWRHSFAARGTRVVALGLRRYGDPVPLIRLRQFIREYIPDVVHAHMPPAEVYTRLALAGMSRRLPFIISKHNCGPFVAAPFQRRLAGWVAERADRVIAISGAVERMVREERIADAGRVVTIPYGINTIPYETVDEEAAIELRRTWGVGKDELLIGTVARLVPQKALHVLIHAFSSLVSQISTPATLVLVGRGPLERSLRDLAKTLGVADRVVWAGFREDIPVVMRAFDVFALCSKYEGFGLVLLEAMAAARPIVATAVSAIPDIVDDEKSGFLVPPGNPYALAARLALCDDPFLRRDLGQNGRAKVREQFSLDAMFRRTGSVYEDVSPNGSDLARS